LRDPSVAQQPLALHYSFLGGSIYGEHLCCTNRGFANFADSVNDLASGRYVQDVHGNNIWSGGYRPDIAKLRRQRDQVYRYFGDVNAQGRCRPIFETGPGRAADMAARDRIRHWQFSPRTFYLLETPLIQFRVFGDISQKSKYFARMDDVIREGSSQSFKHVAESLENQLNKRPYDRYVPRSLVTLLEASQADEQAPLSEREEALLRMLHTIASLVDRMEREVSSDPLYATQ
jgi:multidrug resistance protein MdtO